MNPLVLLVYAAIAGLGGYAIYEVSKSPLKKIKSYSNRKKKHKKKDC